MSVENRIVKVQKRNRALVRFDLSRIYRAILRASQSIGGFQQDYLPGINQELFDAWRTDDKLAAFFAETVVMLLNSNAQHLISNFPPTIEQIQDAVLHSLRSYGFQNTADAYACYRWGRHWLREGAITLDQFVDNGVAREQIRKTQEWNREHGCETIEDLNELIRRGNLKTLVRESLDSYEFSLDGAATKIAARLRDTTGLRMVWVTGPSSSGKTTTTIKLIQRLEKQGLRFLTLNLDDYFWSVVEHPTDWINDRNYEAPEAMDIQLLNQHLKLLLEGKSIDKPVFDFKQGRRVDIKKVRLEPGRVLLLDCLHGLYPPLTEGIPSSAQFRLYLDSHSGVLQNYPGAKRVARSSDLRMLRRMIRDARHRNYSPLRTILHWHYVRAGELFSILPLSGLADHVVNTGFAFELAALKPFFTGTKSHLPTSQDLQTYQGFLDAEIRHAQISKLLESVEGLSTEALAGYDLIPGDAVVREFIGGSTLSIPHNN